MQSLEQLCEIEVRPVKGLVNYGPWIKSSLLPLFIKFYSNAAVLIHGLWRLLSCRGWIESLQREKVASKASHSTIAESRMWKKTHWEERLCSMSNSSQSFEGRDWSQVFPVRQEMKSKDLWGKQNALLFKRFHRTHFWEHPFLLEHTGANVGKSAAQKEWYQNQFPSSLSPGPLTHGVKFTRRAISSYVLWSRKETQMHVWDIFPCQVKVLFPC